ncbi:MAG: hypothetical protein V3T33_08990 [Myxococcota bacterium]
MRARTVSIALGITAPTAVPLHFRLDRPFVIRRAWEEATGAVRPANPPDTASR